MAIDGYDTLTQDEYINIMVNSGTLSREEAERRAYNCWNLGLSYDNAVKQAFPNLSVAIAKDRWGSERVAVMGETIEPSSNGGNAGVAATPSQTQISAYSYNDGQENFIRGILEKNTNYTSEQIDIAIKYGEDNNLSVEELLNKYANNWEGKISSEDNAVDQLLESKPESKEAADATEPPKVEEPTEKQPKPSSDGMVIQTDSEDLLSEGKAKGLPLTFAKFDVPDESFVDASKTDEFNKLDTDELNEFNSNLKKINLDIEGLYDEKGAPYKFDLLYEGLNNETKNKLKSITEDLSDSAMFKSKIYKVLQYWADCLYDICTKIDNSIKTAIDADAGTGPADDGNDPAGSSKFSRLPSNGGGESSKPTTPETSVEGIIGVVGTLTFTAIAPLYETLGATSTIQSNLTGNYDVVGIYLYDNKYFYKIYDKDLKKYYYAEINNTTSFTTSYTQVLKMNEEAMLMTSTKIGDNVLTKYSNPDTVYFVKGTIEDNNINFALITDPSDNQDYYVPLSSSVELVSLEEFTKDLSANLTITQDQIQAIENVG